MESGKSTLLICYQFLHLVFYCVPIISGFWGGLMPENALNLTADTTCRCKMLFFKPSPNQIQPPFIPDCFTPNFIEHQCTPIRCNSMGCNAYSCWYINWCNKEIRSMALYFSPGPTWDW